MTAAAPMLDAIRTILFFFITSTLLLVSIFLRAQYSRAICREHVQNLGAFLLGGAAHPLYNGRIYRRGRGILKSILVVEDEEAIYRVLAAYLKKAGFHVTHAADGQEALDLFDSVQPHLVLLDVMIPVL